MNRNFSRSLTTVSFLTSLVFAVLAPLAISSDANKWIQSADSKCQVNNTNACGNLG